MTVLYYTDPTRHGHTCDVRVDVYGDSWHGHGELEWRTFFRLRDGVLPELMAGSSVGVLDHAGLWTWTWDVVGHSARFAPDETLPPAVRERIEVYEGRRAPARWWERTSATIWTAWKRTGGTHAYGARMYLAYPPNWSAFVVFALAVVLGRKVVKSRNWRTVGFVGLAIILLMPVKVPTFVGWVYMPHGYVQAFDFDRYYYLREGGFALGAAVCTGILAWLLLRLIRRRWDRTSS